MSLFRVVDLAPVVLVPGRPLEGRLLRQARDHPGLPSGIAQVVRDLTIRTDGVPVTVSEPSSGTSDRSLLLYTYGYVVRLFPTPFGDGYIVAGINPLRLRDHDVLGRGHLLVRTTWQVVAELRRIPRGASAHWQRLAGEWAKLRRELGDRREVPEVTPSHGRFLDTLDRLIEVTRQFAARKAENLARYPYRSVESVGERRISASPIYVFHVVGDLLPDRGRFVQLCGEPEQRGEVIRVESGRATVRFDQPLDWNRLARQGELAETPNEVVYAKQREAVQLLRTRQAHNRKLLPVVVDHEVKPLGAVDEAPEDELDSDQLAAFRKALGTQDMLVVLGPPGTGKTRTISEIARACALSPDRGRVLVTSHTNRAVDNVLAKLPRDMVVVRVGNEGKVDRDGRTYLLEQQASEMRGEIVAATAAAQGAYESLPWAGRWTEELGERIDLLSAAVSAEAEARRSLDLARRAAGGTAQRRADELASELGGREARMARRRDRLDRLVQRDSRAPAWTRWPLLRAGADVMAWARSRRIRALKTELACLTDAVTSLRAQLKEALDTLDVVTRDVPQVRAAAGVLSDVLRRRDERRHAARHAADMVKATVGPVDSVPAIPDTGDAAAILAELTNLHGRLGPRLALLNARSKLISEWHSDVSGATEQLYQELIRYADVIGATCTGTASRSEISEETFDLAIVDEAGQIGTADLLIPLVRAERAVLVGDHRQLPPFVDADVMAWSDEIGDPALRDRLTKSGLEILVDQLPATHIVRLTQQRRMPKVIADFISVAFYHSTLTTAVTRRHADPLFSSPMAFVDTSELSEAQRAESAPEERNPQSRGGWLNQAEARLLVRLAGFYQDRGEDWALIVPYRAQLRLIAELLARDIPSLDTIDSNIGTVDAFQGGERDIVLYGFTRSNRPGNVGFLQELRRANVAFTRAKRQLVLVGDMSTLMRARDSDFRSLVRSLRDHIAANGDVRHYHEIRHLLAELERTGAHRS